MPQNSQISPYLRPTLDYMVTPREQQGNDCPALQSYIPLSNISLTRVTFRLWLATPKRDYTDKLLYHQALN